MVFSPTLSFCLKHPSWVSIKCLSKIQEFVSMLLMPNTVKVGNKLNIILLSYTNRYGTTTILCTDNRLWKARHQWEGLVDVFTNIPITAGREHALPGHIIFCKASQKLSPLNSRLQERGRISLQWKWPHRLFTVIVEVCATRCRAWSAHVLELRPEMAWWCK